MSSTLSFASTNSFRTALMGKNLPPYSVPGFYRPQVGDINYETQIGVSNVIDSPDELINSDPFAQQLYPLNQYGPSGGYNIQITYNGIPQPVESNQGEYELTDTKLDLLNETFIDVAATQNKYLPQGGYNDMVVIDDVENNNKIYVPYWEPPSFRPSSYAPYDVLISDNPSGSNGSLSQDSFIARLGSQRLKFSFQKRIDEETFQNASGALNLAGLSNSNQASAIATGQQSIEFKSWKITIPENPLSDTGSFINRLDGNYYPASPIPGDYFTQITSTAGITRQVTTAFNFVNNLTGGLLGGVLNGFRNSSEIFLANTGEAQRSSLFANIDLNRYQPSYTKNIGGFLGLAQTLVSIAASAINENGTLAGGYYVGSVNSDPSQITSPPNQVPTDALGRQTMAPVYGPSEMGIVYEGNENRLRFGLGARNLSDGGTIDGEFVWISPKYKGAAGYKATPGGGTGSIDGEYNLISSSYEKNESININFKTSSILDQTQRLVNSADNVTGQKRLKHVGNAISQVSKVFNDGYKELTKGSQVVSYKDFTNGLEKGIEYCRVFTKDTPYYTYADLQKTDGITISGRRFTNSILDNTYNLNIAPLKNPGSTNIIPNNKDGTGGYAKKYMFSIENLAWRTSSKPGYTYDELPVCEKGPNGGRVMWFPPYDLKFNDTSSASWTPTDFIGRPEQIYTYKNTTRTGTISWSIIVDSPSVLNLIVEQQLKDVKDRVKINSIMDSFFAGCVKYDIYELAKKFNRIPSSELYLIQQKLSNQRVTPEEVRTLTSTITVQNTGGNTGSGQPDPNTNGQATTSDDSVQKFKTEYEDYAFYFENDIPSIGTVPDYDQIYNTYTSDSNIEKYVNNADDAFNSTGSFCKANPSYCENAKKVKEFFDTTIKTNYNKIAVSDSNFIIDAYNILNEGKGDISITMVGSASATATVDYNKSLSKRRLETIKKFLKEKTVGDANLKKFFDSGKIKITLEEGNGELESIPKGEFGIGFPVECSEDVKDGKGIITSISQVYSVNAMSCRRVKIKTIKVIETDVKKEPEKKPTAADEDKKIVTTQTITPKKPQPVIEITQEEKKGISKLVLRKLLTECDYFSMIEKNTPMLYDSIKEKIKYFNPAFHSMTPEGLNSRITFLNQCVRPGETIPIIGTDGKPKYNDALNTSFGAPPVLVLRIGDFYHTKVIPDNVSFTYDPLIYDMNPEGIGVQPMIVKVSMNVKFIGGHGIQKPVEQLQNALSFNYYANTEIYDERAVWTEDTSKLDKQILNSIIQQEKPVTKKDVDNKPQNSGGDTIGEIITNIPVPSGQTGEIGYQKIMDKLQENTKLYMETIVNSLEKITLQSNFGIMQLVNDTRNYTEGSISANSLNETLILYGKSEKYEERLQKLFTDVLIGISDNTNPIFEEFNNRQYEFTNDVTRQLKENMINYITAIQEQIKLVIAGITQETVLLEQDYVQLLRKCNLIDTKTDGKILDTGEPRIYNLEPTENISQSTRTNNPNVTNTYEEFYTDFKSIPITIDEFNTVILKGKLEMIDSIYNDGDFNMANENNFSGINNKLFFLVIGRIFSNKDKKEEFKKKIITGSLLNVKSPVNLRKKFDDIVDDLAKKYSKEIEDEEKLFSKTKKSKEYKDLIDGIDEKTYPKGKNRKFKYTTVVNQQKIEQQKIDVINLYKTVNVNNDNKTWVDKIKFS
jgi:hypothetical protein